MSVQTEAPLDHPMRIAWEKYKQTPEYANTKHWALYKGHEESSLWASFVEGFMAGERASS